MKNQNIKYWSKWLYVFLVCWSIVYFSKSSDVEYSLVDKWPFVLLGFGAAILGNISAIGGGLVFIPCMMFIFKLPPVLALKVALLSQCFGMTSGALTWLQKITIPKKIFLLTIPSLLVGSCISTFVFHPSPLLVKVFFGPVSIVLGLLTLLTIYYKKENQTGFELNFKQEVGLVLVSLLGGIITGWVAIGEGELVSAYLMLVAGVSVPLSIGLGVVLLAVNSLFLSVLHQFFFEGLPWHIGLFTGLGCVFGARLAPYLAQYMQPKKLKIIFSIIAIGDGILFIYQFFK